MSGIIGALSSPQTIPDATQPVQGIPGSRASFFLRSTPRVFTVIAAGNSNQDFQIRATKPVEVQQIMLGTRLGNFNPPRVDFPLYKSGGAVISAVGAGADAVALTKAGAGIAAAKGSGVKDAGAIAFTPSGLYASLLEADRSIGWWGFNDDAELLDGPSLKTPMAKRPLRQ